MTPDERVKAVANFGFTDRQARFLVTVLLYAGICVPRQYATFAGIAYGHKVSRFFDVLANYNFAVVSDCLHNRARVYHLADARLYAAIGQPHSRYRRRLAARQALDRLLRLDALISFPNVRHIVAEDEKVALFSALAPFGAARAAAARRDREWTAHSPVSGRPADRRDSERPRGVHVRRRKA